MASATTHDAMANVIRALSMDSVEKANSGHPGLPMGAADMAIDSAKVRVGLKAAVRQGWDALIADGPFIGMTSFGASAPYKPLYEHFGIAPRALAAAALARLAG
jgi:transketolase